MSSEIEFPDEARSALDRVIGELVERAREVLQTQGRLRALLRANQAVVEQLELPLVLQRIVDSAVELVGAEYGALGVIAPHGGLEQFIYVGMTPHQVEEIGHLPEGHGLLGALIDDPRAIRLADIADDERSAGFPAHHPPMQSFLGVPVRVHDEVYGNLYLTNHPSGQFSAEDEQLMSSLAATAGFAIENARLFQESQQRQAWAAASAEVTAALLSADERDTVSIVAEQVLRLSDSELVALVRPSSDPNILTIGVAQGRDAHDLVGRSFKRGGTLSTSVLEGSQPRIFEEAEFTGLQEAFGDGRTSGPVVTVPLMGSNRVFGALVAARPSGAPRFTAFELEMMADFAGQASVAMELAAARADGQKVMLLEDRSRIARDLHDHVIQQLFATGLELQGFASSLPAGVSTSTIRHSIDNLDAAIVQIRTAIFALAEPPTTGQAGVRHRIIDLASEYGDALGGTPRVSFSGPIDLAIDGSLAEDVLAVVREGLANIVKHARASEASVSVKVADGFVTVEVTDNGAGMPASGRRSGIANLESRAALRGGAFTINSDSSGTTLNWRVAIDSPDD